MKKLFLAGAVALFGMANAQLSEGNWMVGGSVADLTFTNPINLTINPKAGYFVKNNWAVGAETKVVIQGNNANIDLGAFTRYYFSENEITTLTNNGRFFAEGSVGFSGINQAKGATTNGVGLGIGAGYAYFLTPNVALEGMLKLNGVAGGGNQNFNGKVNLGVGFQIYLPNAKAKQVLKDQQ